MAAQHVKIAIVTGGCSGIGLTLTRHLLSHPTQQWRVVVADINEAAYAKIADTLDPARHTFVACDVSSWDAQAALFERAFAFAGGRIDFLAANAGIAESAHLLTPWDLSQPPQKPDLRCVDVNLTALFYGLKLFVHYARLTRSRTTDAAASDTAPAPAPFNPKLVMTASCAGLYPFPLVPQYNVTKTAVVALTRSVGKNLYAAENIAVNCICPAYVAGTGMTPAEITARWPPEWITPIAAMTRAYDELIAEDGAVAADGKSDGRPGKVKAGQAVECVVDKLYYRRGVDFADESQRWLIEQSFTADGVWQRGLDEAMKKRAGAVSAGHPAQVDPRKETLVAGQAATV